MEPERHVQPAASTAGIQARAVIEPRRLSMLSVADSEPPLLPRVYRTAISESEHFAWVSRECCRQAARRNWSLELD